MNFVAKENPNGLEIPFWPAYDTSLHVVIELDDGFVLCPVADDVRLEIFHRYFQTQNDSEYLSISI